ncbi:MAG: pyridoxamine 5'-phosphate oxidase family protein [Paludibacteraceae bacterium]|nr:pyridoxamine 5'-phosphate oxidase family protein [Paludibacteraceae bacterium]
METRKKLLVAIMTLCLFSCTESTENTNTNDTQANQTEIIDPTKYQTNNMENIQKVHDFIKKCGVYYLATDDNGQPRVRPFGTIHIFEGKLYIQTGHRKRTAQQLSNNSKAELCAYDIEKGTWIRVSGTLVEDTRVEAKKSMLDDYTSLRKMYDENDDNTAVYFFKDGVAYLSSFGEEDIEIRW